MTYGWTTAPVDAQTKSQLEDLAEALDETQSGILRELVSDMYAETLGDPREPHVRSLPEDRTPPEERQRPRNVGPTFNL